MGRPALPGLSIMVTTTSVENTSGRDGALQEASQGGGFA